MVMIIFLSIMVVWYVSVWITDVKKWKKSNFITIKSAFSIFLPEQKGFGKGFWVEVCQTGSPVQGTTFLEKDFIQKCGAWSSFSFLRWRFGLRTYRFEQRWKLAEILGVEILRLSEILSRHNFHWQGLCAQSLDHSIRHTCSFVH